MTDQYEVVVHHAMRPGIEIWAVGIRHRSTGHMAEIIADDLPIATAMQLGRRVQTRLDEGHSIADIRRHLDLENAGISA